MKWINILESLPEPWLVVWIFWRDREVLLGCRTNKEDEPMDGWYSFEDEKCRWTNWWMPINAASYDKPNPPNQPERSKREDLIDNGDCTETCNCGCGSTYLKDAVL